MSRANSELPQWTHQIGRELPCILFDNSRFYHAAGLDRSEDLPNGTMDVLVAHFLLENKDRLSL